MGTEKAGWEEKRPKDNRKVALKTGAAGNRGVPEPAASLSSVSLARQARPNVQPPDIRLAEATASPLGPGTRRRERFPLRPGCHRNRKWDGKWACRSFSTPAPTLRSIC